MTNPSNPRVRVTFEASLISEHHGVVRLGGVPGAGHLLLDTSAEGIELERLQPSYTWTAGDVVQSGTHGWVARRRCDGSWYTTETGPTKTWGDDTDVTAWVIDGRMDVLRYHAGQVPA